MHDFGGPAPVGARLLPCAYRPPQNRIELNQAGLLQIFEWYVDLGLPELFDFRELA
jgi:hypothetical protein